MRRAILMVFLLTAMVYGQEQGTVETVSPALPPPPPPDAAHVTEANIPLNPSDLYCAGFVSEHPLPRNRFVAGGVDSPVQFRFQDRQFVYLRGDGYTPGTRVSFVREMQDVNDYTPFPEIRKMGQRAGRAYGEIGYAAVVEIRGAGLAVAQVEFTCDGSVATGDLAIPFVAKGPLSYRKISTLDQFPEQHGKVSGRIIGTRDLDLYPRPGQKIYLNVGERNGVRAGDYFRIVRAYGRKVMDPVDAEMFNSTAGEDTQKDPPKMLPKNLVELPRHVLGEAIVISTQPGSATAMITFALSEIQLGDWAELEEVQAR